MSSSAKKKSLDLSATKSQLDHSLCQALDPHHFQRISKSVIIENGKSLAYEVHLRGGPVFSKVLTDKTKIEAGAKHLIASMKESVAAHLTPKKKPSVKLS